MTMINKQELLEWLYEERCNAQRQLNVREVGDSDWHEYKGRAAAFNYAINHVNGLQEVKPLQAEPKFRVGDRVRMSKGLFENQTGKITDMYYSYEIKTDAGANVIADEPYFEIEPVEDEPTRPNFKVGDRVKILFGIHKGCIGTIIDKVDDEPANMIQFDEGRKTWGNTATIELIKDEPAPSAKDIKVAFKLTGAEAFIESAKQLIEALEALEVKIDDDTDTK